MRTSDRVREVLSSRGLTLYQVSQKSEKLFGRSSLYFIPQRLYHELALGALTPNLHQMAAFSQISDYRLVDWLALFGFHLDDIPKLQSLLSHRRTVLLDTSVYDPEQWLPWFEARSSPEIVPSVEPLGQFLIRAAPTRAKNLIGLNKRRFLYVKVGRDDAFAFPTLAPGSIGRVDVRCNRNILSTLGSSRSKKMYLVEHGSCLNCGHLRRTGNDTIVLCSTHFPFTQAELTLDGSVRILGVVDAEIRPLVGRPTFKAVSRVATLDNALDPTTPERWRDLRQLIRISRTRAGISFREASTASRWIARILADEAYFAAAGTLSDYEHASLPVRHIQKIFSLCIMYGIDFWSFLRAVGIPVDSLGSVALSDHLISRIGYSKKALTGATTNSSEQLKSAGILSALIEEWEELPVFMATALPALTGLRDLSLSNIFWVGRTIEPNHPCLAGASLLSVNRRVKTPMRTTGSTLWEQPLYVLLLRGGGYLCGACELQRGYLIVNPHSERPQNSIRLRNGIDAEVVGRVSAILRHLL